MFYGCKFTIIFRHSIHFCTKTAKTWAGTRADILYHLGFPLFISLHYYYLLRKPLPAETVALDKRGKDTGEKGIRHWVIGKKVPSCPIRAAARIYKGARPYYCERAGL